MGNVLGEQTKSQNEISAYNNFLCTYGLLHTEMLPDDAIQCATRMWCSFSPEQQMSYAQLFPSKIDFAESEMRSGDVNRPQPVALPKKRLEKKLKVKLKAKAPANKSRAKKKHTPTALKRIQISAKKKRNTAFKRIKSKAKTRQKPSKTTFKKFFLKLRAQYSDITDEEIVKKAAKAWCKMNPQQRLHFVSRVKSRQIMSLGSRLPTPTPLNQGPGYGRLSRENPL